MPVRSIIRLVFVAAAALALSACPSLTERAGLPPSLERAEALERAGDAAGAARVYEGLAAQNSGAERNALLLRAARGYLAAHHAEDAARVLAMPEGPLSAEQSNERALSNVELGHSIHFEVPGVAAFDGTVTGETMEGKFSDGSGGGSFRLERQHDRDDPLFAD